MNRSLNEWLLHIEQCHVQSMVLGLERIKAIGQQANLLTFACPIVMVAGTNGKGSTVITLAKLLQAAGLKVGAYISPHLLDFNERIQINGQAVSDETLCHSFEVVEKARQGKMLTFFEFTTLAAFYIFQSHSLDIIILEVGMGGRLDAVNVVDADLAIITSIGFDHQQWLGHSLEAIAYEKAGILRANIPLVLSMQARISSLFDRAKTLHNTLYVENKDFDFLAGTSFSHWQFQGKMIKLPYFELPANSVSLSLAAYQVLAQSFSLPALESLISCLEGERMMGRFCCLKIADKTIYLDVAHNGAASAWLAQRWKALNLPQKLIAVWSSLADKDLAAIVKPLRQIVDCWWIGELKVERAASIDKLYQTLIDQGIEKIFTQASIFEAFTEALKSASSQHALMVFGSFYTVAQVLTEGKQLGLK